MSINSSILKKLKEKTEDNVELRDIILSIMQKENDGLGNYKSFYKSTAEKLIKENVENEN